MKRVIGIIVAIAVIAGVVFGLTAPQFQLLMIVQATVVLNVVSSFSIINEISQEVGGKYVNAHHHSNWC